MVVHQLDESKLESIVKKTIQKILEKIGAQFGRMRRRSREVERIKLTDQYRTSEPS